MNQELQKVNQEVINFISLEEASQQLGITYGQLVKWLNTNKEIKEKYCFKAKYNGRRRTLIYVEALLVIANVKDSDRGNQSKIAPSATFQKGKQELAETVVEQVKTSQSLESLYAQAQMLVQTIEGLLHVQVKVENHEERIATLEGDPDTMPIVDGQRKILAEFCNRLHFGLKEQGKNVHFSSIRKDLNIAVGKHSVEEYTQADYFRAISVLKRWYKQQGVQW